MRSRSAALAAAATLAAAASMSGCGGGGDSGGAVAGGSLAFSVAWEQPGGVAQGFDTPIPPSVSAIRIILDPEGAPPCCIAVVRGSSAFEDRHLVLADVPVGEATVEVFGFPTDFAPDGGVGATCDTRDGEGEPCSSQDTLPSFGSDETPVDVEANQQNRVDVDVYSLPFVHRVNIDEGAVVIEGDIIDVKIVDANFPIDEDVEVSIVTDDDSLQLPIVFDQRCDDNGNQLSCSFDGELEVQGLTVGVEYIGFLPAGPAVLRVEASNEASPPRDMVFELPILLSDVTTTTITTTTLETTTTTLAEPETFCLLFSLDDDVELVGLSFTAGYAATGGDFVGSGEEVECISLMGESETMLASFNDDDEVSLSAAVIDAEAFSGPTDLALCTFLQVPPLNLAGFSIQVTEATAPDLTSTSATVIVEEASCLD